MSRDAPRTVAVLAHGAGSTAEFALRAFPPRTLGVDEVVALDDRTGRVDRVMDALEAAATSLLAAGHRVVLGGVSLGAHAAARLAVERALRHRVSGLVLALPAWTGAPDRVAAATVAAADEIADQGSARVLRRLTADPALRDDWVVAELARAWPTYGDEVLVAALRAAGRSPSVTEEGLRSLRVATTVVALADDPLHPETVARTWARAVEGARLVVRSRRSGPPLLPADG